MDSWGSSQYSSALPHSRIIGIVRTTASLEDGWEVDDVASRFEDTKKKKNTRLFYFHRFSIVEEPAEAALSLLYMHDDAWIGAK